jgi:M6 family metalloprotease-like protein
MKRLFYVLMFLLFIGLVGCDFLSTTTTAVSISSGTTSTGENLNTLTTTMQTEVSSTFSEIVSTTRNETTTSTVSTTAQTTTQVTTQMTTTQITTAQTTTTQTTTTQTTTLVEFDSSELNALFGFDIYALMPEIISDDYDVLDYSDVDFMEVYIDVFDWTENDADNYMDALDLLLTYDNTEQSWIIADYYLYVYEDDESYPGEMVYGVGIYGSADSSIIDTEIDPSELNDIFGFDIYALIPKIMSGDYDVLDYSDVDFVEVYIDVFDWTENDANNYMDALDLLLTYDNTEQSWIVGDYYLYVYEDDESYPGEMVYGLAIYGVKETIIIDTELDPTELNDLFGFDIYALMPEIITGDYEVFDYSDVEYMEVYIDLFDWTENDANDYMDALDLLLTYDDTEQSWIIGDYYLYVYEDDQSYPGEMVYGVGIYGYIATEVVYNTFEDAMNEVEILLNDAILSSMIPTFDSLYNITVDKLTNTKVLITGLSSINVDTAMNSWLSLLEAEGFILDVSLSNEENDFYSISINEDLTYAISITNQDNTLMILLWAFDPELDTEILSTIPAMTTINEFEVNTFGQSGLPSTGTFDVLVIPVEIPGSPFPSDYYEKLDLVFNGSPEATGWQSVSSFYQTSSYGLLNMSFDIVTKFTLANNQAYYESKGDGGDQFAIYEALIGLDDSIDFSQYDSNQDGTIDAVYFIYSVEYNYDVDPWWAWVFTAQYGEASNIDTLDGLEFEYYTWISYSFIEDEIQGSDGLTVNAETIIHETGHLMGALDMYSYTEDYGPLGAMGMMDYNNGDHDPLHKILYGWSTPYLATQGIYEVTLESYAIDIDGLGSALVIPYNYSAFEDGDAFDEFLVIFFYTPEGLYEEHLGLSYVLDHAGIIVYHVDARLSTNPTFFSDYFMYNNDGTSDFFAELLEVDGNNSLDGDYISMSDILTTGTFDISSYSWHQGGSINISIEITSVITDNSDEVTFILTVE